MVEMRLAAVRVEMPSNTPVVLLEEVGGEGRTLPIFISSDVATAIAYALQGVVTQRPFTHDLMKNLLVEMGATVQQVVVTELREGTYYAEIVLALGGRTHRVSSRPSDAIALAARTDTGIFCDDDLLESEGVRLQSDEAERDEDPDKLVDDFRSFIDHIKPEDFHP